MMCISYVFTAGMLFTGDHHKQLKQKESVVMPKKQAPGGQEFHGSDDEFGGDDILGLIDTPQKPTAATKKTSRFDELLGRKQPQEDKQQPKEKEQFSLNTDHNNLSSNTESNAGTVSRAEDNENNRNPSSDFQFGGYLPSTMSSGGSNRKSRGLPQGRRKGLSDMVTSERPSTAPGKKSVRFSDTIHSSNDVLRPSSTPAVKGHVREEDTNMVNQHQSSDKGLTTNLKDTELKMPTTTTTTTVKEKSTIPQSNQLLTNR